MSGARGLRSEDPSDVRARTVLQATWRLYLHSLYSDDILQNLTVSQRQFVLYTILSKNLGILDMVNQILKVSLSGNKDIYAL